MPFKMKGFEAHNMYKTERANTHDEHLALEEKGYDHSPYTKKETPCWDTHTNIVNGEQTFKKKGGKMVPDCKPK